jgi:uncharacterized membrane protein (DUF485 family)
MSDGNAPDAARATSGARDGQAPQVDWTRIEGSEEFRELTGRRHRFIAVAAGISFGGFLIYLGLAVFATGFMGTTVAGGVPIAWLLAMTQVLITWGVTWTYLRKADSEFEPLEERVTERAGARFTRTEEATSATEPAGETAEHRTTERSAR